MALSETLKQRLITAVILIALVLGSVFLTDRKLFNAVFSIILAFAAWEWGQLIGLKSRVDVLYALVIVGVTSLLVREDFSLIICLASIGFWLLAWVWVWRFPRDGAYLKQPWLLMLIGACVIMPCGCALWLLKRFTDGEAWIIYVFALVGFADTGAYFSGRRWGKSKLAAEVSPGKSWAGFWGGFAAAGSLAAVVAVLQFEWSWQALLFWLVSSLVIVFSVIGDLFESSIKRLQGVKDSGQLLPGHGGLLDRVDSLTAALPMFVAFTVVSTQFGGVTL
jgi:phosphatidate cytidylyltransferase